MNREQKAAAVEEIASQIADAEAIFAMGSASPRPPSCARG
jgi:hypothetical protein